MNHRAHSLALLGRTIVSSSTTITLAFRSPWQPEDPPKDVLDVSLSLSLASATTSFLIVAASLLRSCSTSFLCAFKQEKQVWIFRNFALLRHRERFKTPCADSWINEPVLRYQRVCIYVFLVMRTIFKCWFRWLCLARAFTSQIVLLQKNVAHKNRIHLFKM